MDIRGFCSGLRYAMPIMLGYFPVGFAYGVLAVKAGLSPFWAGMMSFFVYAGSAQFIAVGMLVAGASVPAIVLVTFVVNLRHLLMSAALTPFVRTWGVPAQAWFAFELTDESFAMNLGRFSTRGAFKPETFGMNFFAHMTWVAAGVLGAAFSSTGINLEAFGLDFALAGMFVALLLPWLRMRRGLVAALVAGGLSLALEEAMGGQRLHVLVAAIAGATVACLFPDKAPAQEPAEQGKEHTNA